MTLSATAAVTPDQAVLVDLPSNRVPEGARPGYFRTEDNVRLRYATWPRAAEGHKGTVCLVHGRTEFIEKYFETIEDFRRRGFAVATFDWRGQGGSERLIGHPHHGHVERFEDFWLDLKSFHRQILLPECPPPFYLVGHSMGGLASLFAAANDRMMFDRVFLSAPMIWLPNQPLPPAGMAFFTRALGFLGLSQMPVSRPADRPPSRQAFEGNPLTSDLERYMRTVDVYAARPELEVSVPTLGWAAAAMTAMAEVARDDFPARIRVPVLMLAAACDRVVASAATEQLGLRMRTGRHVVIPGARHELFMETDAIRAQVFAAFDAFVTEQSE
ncbi:alpha/beta fold hydrolase [Devosia nitrariae]|uniref:Lysophospholipase n=1 Tax=Devosia nitrariae TaxID=2071872 RepID=A0ABQ5WBE6_9HYPH|nr:alpha/beta hydrolase [Devosia nitrariae]GLQ56941.1 lysophospholipase [Devosia nitrariae]